VSERIKDLRFYKMDTLDGSILFRWTETTKLLLTDRWDRSRNAWLDDPTFYEVTGIGGSSDYDRLSENEALRLMVRWGYSPTDAERLLREGL